ncbi:MAG TPA: tryptophan--tRNA ligase, partial [Candidatus Angelobacter sp.]|jgi:tryptophanyl-tRNA synthetase|nr:tryptophan--tRNA ligase [Candidatus Angelobacter sp.]
MTELPQNQRSRVLSGMRPTGKLHLGNYVGALQNWVKLQHTHHCFFFVADWHALTTDYEDTSRVADNSVEVLLDWLGAGLDPKLCTMFVQSHVRQHAELHVLFSMVTPLSWLERVPTYKEQQQNLATKDLATYGFLGYPLLQAADILIYQADFVPVGEDQVAHVELTREVARRFNHFYSKNRPANSPLIKEPQVLLTKTPKLLGLDGRKMSKSYGNSILLSEEADSLAKKIHDSVTDRPALTDKGNPDRCPVGNLHQIFSPPDRLAYITEGCTQATIRCVDCKALAVESTEAHLKPIRERRKQFAAQPELVRSIVEQGERQAHEAAEATMREVRDAVGLFRTSSLKEHIPVQTGPERLRVPAIDESATADERYDAQTAEWFEKVTRQFPLRKDKPRTYITRKGRKVGIQTAAEANGAWEFRFADRPLNVLTLLAQDSARYLHDYVLPPKLVQQHWKQFERVNGDVVVRLKKVAKGDVVLESSDGEIAVQQFEGDYDELQ